MGDVAEIDWKLFRKGLPGWRESYMEKLVGEYMGMPSGEGLASERFWALEKRVNEDKGRLGVMIRDVRRSTMHYEIARLAQDGVIAPADLDGFTEDLKRYVQRCLE